MHGFIVAMLKFLALKSVKTHYKYINKSRIKKYRADLM